MNYVKFPYQLITEDLSMPYAWVRLSFGKSFYDEWALIDSGAEVNVIPYSVGIKLGLSWDTFDDGPTIGGSASGQTKTVDLTVTIGSFTNVLLTFCWLNHDNVKILFGEQDFFELFAVYFDLQNKEFALFRYSEPI
jgi:hypothetical protein